jgi:hypothetical protein
MRKVGAGPVDSCLAVPLGSLSTADRYTLRVLTTGPTVKTAYLSAERGVHKLRLSDRPDRRTETPIHGATATIFARAVGGDGSADDNTSKVEIFNYADQQLLTDTAPVNLRTLARGTHEFEVGLDQAPGLVSGNWYSLHALLKDAAGAVLFDGWRLIFVGASLTIAHGPFTEGARSLWIAHESDPATTSVVYSDRRLDGGAPGRIRFYYTSDEPLSSGTVTVRDHTGTPACGSCAITMGCSGPSCTGFLTIGDLAPGAYSYDAQLTQQDSGTERVRSSRGGRARLRGLPGLVVRDGVGQRAAVDGAPSRGQRPGGRGRRGHGRGDGLPR